MILTSAQKTALKNDIAANTTSILNPTTGQQMQIKNIPADDGGGANAIADWYNLAASPSFFVNYSTVPAADIMNAVNWKNFTPVDAIPTTVQLDVAVWTARATACQGFQFNLQTMLVGRDSIDATKSSIVSGFKDATQNVPSGVGGANQTGGWTAIQKILCRLATNAEKLLADTSGGGTGADNTHAATATFEGFLTGVQVFDARATG